MQAEEPWQDLIGRRRWREFVSSTSSDCMRADLEVSRHRVWRVQRSFNFELLETIVGPSSVSRGVARHLKFGKIRSKIDTLSCRRRRVAAPSAERRERDLTARVLRNVSRC